MEIEIGKKAPEFTGLIDKDKTISLAELEGKWVVLYFYPKDDTSGCTKEACGFRDGMEQLSSLDTVVIGVSPDSLSSHDKFKAKFNLNFNLIADTEKELCNLFEVIGEKSMYGKKYLGVMRSTFIIDDKGIVRYINRKVKAEGHAEVIIKELEKLRV